MGIVLNTGIMMELCGVITTILVPSIHVINFATRYPLFVAGDRKTNDTLWTTFAKEYPNVKYLSAEYQESMNFEIIRHLKWNHFGRKSVGYLAALEARCERIYDFDDDNGLLPHAFDKLETLHTKRVHVDGHLFNPYPLFVPTYETRHAFMWPRGFPLRYINNQSTHGRIGEPVSNSHPAVIQLLADIDPDVDAMYRLTRPLPIRFMEDAHLLEVPPGVFVPWNAQAVLVNSVGFFGLLLPISVPGRVSDIWRSYIVSRLLWETEHTLAFGPALVEQFRNPHDYMDDFAEERLLYEKAETMVRVLFEWSSKGCDSLDCAYTTLVNHLVQHELLGDADAVLARAWVSDLKRLNYVWPRKQTSRSPLHLPEATVIDHRRSGTHVMVQFNWDVTPERVEKWKSVWRKTIAGSSCVVYAPTQIKEVETYHEDRGYFSPYVNLVRELDLHRERVTGVLYVHDDLLVSKRIVPLLSSTQWLVTYLPQVDGHCSVHGCVKKSEEVSTWMWWDMCQRSFSRIAKDADMAPFFKGQFNISVGQSDFLYVPTNDYQAVRDFMTLLRIFHRHKLFLECAIPTAVELVVSMHKIERRETKLCTNWTQNRRNPSTWPCITDPASEVFHPLKNSDWLSYLHLQSMHME